MPACAPNSRHLLTITARAFTNQAFTPKDVLDAHLLLLDGGAACGSATRELAQRYGAGRELNRLLALLDEHLPADEPGRQAARATPLDLAGGGIRRAAHLTCGLLVRPGATAALAAQHHVLMGERRLPPRLWRGLVARRPAAEPFGPWRFGLPCRAVGPPPAGDAPELLTTPVGEFLLTPTSDLDADVLDRLQVEPLP